MTNSQKILFKSLLTIVIIICPLLKAYGVEKTEKHDSSLPIEITSNELKVERDKNLATFSGDVLAKQGEMSIKSEELIINYRDENPDKEPNKPGNDKKKSSIKKIVANKKVYFSTPTENSSSDSAVFDVEKNILTLENNITLKQDKNILTGSKLTYDLNTGKSTLVNESKDNKPGKVHGIFIPKQ